MPQDLYEQHTIYHQEAKRRFLLNTEVHNPNEAQDTQDYETRSDEPDGKTGEAFLSGQRRRSLLSDEQAAAPDAPRRHIAEADEDE